MGKRTSRAGVESRSNPATRMASFILLGKFISFFMLAASFIVVVRILGPSVYGIYTVAIAIAGFIGATGTLGIDTAVNKFISEYRGRGLQRDVEEVLANGFSALIIIGVVLVVLTIVMSGALAKSSLHDVGYAYLIQIGAVTIVGSMLFAAATAALVGMDKGREVTACIIAMALVQSSLSIALALAGWGALAPIVGLASGYLVGIAAAVLFIYIKGRMPIRKPSVKGIGEIIRFSLPIALSNFFGNSMPNLVLVVLGVMATSFVVGNVGVASKTAYLMDMISGSIGMSLLPAMAGGLARGESKKKIGSLYAKAVYFSFLLLMPMLAVLIVFAKAFSYTAFSSRYSLAPAYIQIFSLGFMGIIIGTYTAQLLISANRTREVAKYSGIIAAAELVLIPVMIPTMGGMGAALLMFLITPLLTAILFVRAARRHFGINFNSKKIARVVLANAVTALLFLPVGFAQVSFAVMIAASALIIFIAYPPLLALSGGVDRNDLGTARAIGAGIPVVEQAMVFFANYSERFLGR